MPAARRYAYRRGPSTSNVMKKTKTKKKAYKKKTYKKSTYKKKCVTKTQARTIAKSVVRGTLAKSVFVKQRASWKYAANGAIGVAHNKQAIHEFAYMQPLELMDAVSTLFNNKTKSFSYTALTGNFLDIRFDIQYTLYGEIRNNSNTSIELDMYWVVAKQDSDTGAYLRWLSSMAGGNSEAGPSTLHSTPYDSNTEFTRYWTVESKKTIRLQPGQTTETGFKSPKMDINWDKMYYGGNIPGYKKGITRELLVVQRNPILWDTTGNVVGRPHQHYGGWIYEERMEITCHAPEQTPAAFNTDKVLLLESYGIPDVSVNPANVQTNAPSRVILDSSLEYRQ